MDLIGERFLKAGGYFFYRLIYKLGGDLMKKLLLSATVAAFFQVTAFAQMGGMQIEGKEVAGNDDVVFHQIDEILCARLDLAHTLGSHTIQLANCSRKEHTAVTFDGSQWRTQLLGDGRHKPAFRFVDLLGLAE